MEKGVVLDGSEHISGREREAEVGRRLVQDNAQTSQQEEEGVTEGVMAIIWTTLFQ